MVLGATRFWQSAPAVVDAGATEMTALQQIAGSDEPRATSGATRRKLDSHLVAAIEKARTGTTATGAPTLDPDVKIVEGRALVDIDATVSDDLLAEIAAHGQVISAHRDYDSIRAMVALPALDSLAARSDVRFIAPAAQGTTN
jgi:hypothetical protein